MLGAIGSCFLTRLSELRFSRIPAVVYRPDRTQLPVNKGAPHSHTTNLPRTKKCLSRTRFLALIASPLSTCNTLGVVYATPTVLLWRLPSLLFQVVPP
ncbi:hypothetical protein NDU88_002304 [Pleurodeles waltl]|uniref:Uncharacterized protein n=1 Tax=Pleurodeles waltl TaxID=8319 RepID=A0AAV7WP29_PLEWA|nr:hypothetical protein NDU88_002304 [Pleurodeles waltl]